MSNFSRFTNNFNVSDDPLISCQNNEGGAANADADDKYQAIDGGASNI